jgi:GAF domain-containing protein
MTVEFDPTGEMRRKLLTGLNERLALASSLNEIIDIVRAVARAAVSADGVTFVLREGSKCHYVEEDAIGPLWKGQKFPMEICISGWCMLHDETAAIEDIFSDPRIPHDVYRKTFVRSLIMTPVKTDAPVAAIGAYWSLMRRFSPHDIASVETLASYVADAMKRVA